VGLIVFVMSGPVKKGFFLIKRIDERRFCYQVFFECLIVSALNTINERVLDIFFINKVINLSAETIEETIVNTKKNDKPENRRLKSENDHRKQEKIGVGKQTIGMG